MGIKKHDDMGRVITAEFEKFILVSTYTPNAGETGNKLRYAYRTYRT